MGFGGCVWGLGGVCKYACDLCMECGRASEEVGHMSMSVLFLCEVDLSIMRSSFFNMGDIV